MPTRRNVSMEGQHGGIDPMLPRGSTVFTVDSVATLERPMSRMEARAE